MGEKILNIISDKELIFKVYKEFIQLKKQRKTKIPFLKVSRRSE